MALSIRRCRLCNSQNIKDLFDKNNLIFSKCLSCRVVFLLNRLSSEETQNIYVYYAKNHDWQLSSVTRRRYQILLNSFKKYRRTGWLLDVGCGRGDFLEVAQEYGWDVIGTEISKEAYQLGLKKNLNVFHGDIKNIPLEESKFDIVTLFEVIEHVNEPEVIIKQIHKVLRKGGKLYLTTPNFNSLSRLLLKSKWRVFHIEHLFYFTPQSMKEILRRNGFRIINVRTKNISMGELIKLFVFTDSYSIYSRRYDNNIRKKIDSSSVLSATKTITNLILNIVKRGDTIEILAERL